MSINYYIEYINKPKEMQKQPQSRKGSRAEKGPEQRR
jgi:hypothetical protein